MPAPTSPTVSRAWLHRFALEVRATTRSSLDAANTCILTTRVGQMVLDEFGISSRPTPVFVTVHNREAWDLSQHGIPVSQWPETAHSVGVNEDSHLSRQTGWNGHLVLLVRQPGHLRLLVDLTADQFDRPARNLVVGGPVFMDLPDGKLWTPQDPLFTVVGDRFAPDTIISYRPMPPGHSEARRWQETPDWTSGPDEVRAYAEAIAARLPAPADTP